MDGGGWLIHKWWLFLFLVEKLKFNSRQLQKKSQMAVQNNCWIHDLKCQGLPWPHIILPGLATNLWGVSPFADLQTEGRENVSGLETLGKWQNQVLVLRAFCTAEAPARWLRASVQKKEKSWCWGGLARYRGWGEAHHSVYQWLLSAYCLLSIVMSKRDKIPVFMGLAGEDLKSRATGHSGCRMCTYTLQWTWVHSHAYLKCHHLSARGIVWATSHLLFLTCRFAPHPRWNSCP